MSLIFVIRFRSSGQFCTAFCATKLRVCAKHGMCFLPKAKSTALTIDAASSDATTETLSMLISHSGQVFRIISAMCSEVLRSNDWYTPRVIEKKYLSISKYAVISRKPFMLIVSVHKTVVSARFLIFFNLFLKTADNASHLSST